eukprot:3957562-Amphidinium_carterae.1
MGGRMIFLKNLLEKLNSIHGIHLSCPPFRQMLWQRLDLSNFATYKEWYAALHAVPIAVAQDSEVMTSYKPICHDMIGFDLSVSSISDLVPPSKDHVFISISWDAKCVKPPHRDF